MKIKITCTPAEKDSIIKKRLPCMLLSKFFDCDCHYVHSTDPSVLECRMCMNDIIEWEIEDA